MRPRKRSVKRQLIAVGACSAVLAFSSLATPAATAGQESTEGRQPLSSDEDFVDDFLGVADLGTLGPVLEKAFGHRLGGYWVDRSGTQSVLLVGVVDANVSDTLTLAAVGARGDRIRIVSVKYSQKTLEEMAATAREIVGLAHNRTAGVDTAENVVKVYVEESDADLDAALAGSLLQDGYRIVTGFSSQLTHTSRTQYPPYEAGLELVLGQPSPGPECTSAFTTKRTFLPLFYYGLTAGHCGPTGTEVHIGNDYISNIGSNAYSQMTSNSDSARYFLPLTAQASRIYTGGNNGHRSVVGQMANGELTQGVRLCFQGAASDNNNCGFINFVDTRLSTRTTIRSRIGGASISHRCPGTAEAQFTE